jgi:hypothetical protein
MSEPQRRKNIPLRAQLHAALYQLGFEPHEVDLDHDPALGLRPWNEETQDTIPTANDPKYLVWRPKAEHKLKTTGRKGESDLSITGNGDVSRIAKADRLAEDHEAFRKRLLTRQCGEPYPRKNTIKSRPFTRPKGKKKRTSQQAS